jgi:urease accessory protein UreE
MIRANKVLGQHSWTHAAADTVVLDFDDRHRRRMAMTGTRGLEFLLDLENAVALRGGDALVLEDGRLVEVVAAAEPLGAADLQIRCIWSGSPGISVIAICRRRSCQRACASAGITSSRRW